MKTTQLLLRCCCRARTTQDGIMRVNGDKKKRGQVVTILISCQELDQAREKPFTIQRDRESVILRTTGGVVSPSGHRRDNKTKRARIKTSFSRKLKLQNANNDQILLRTHRVIIQEHDNTSFCLPPHITPESDEHGRTHRVLYTDTTAPLTPPRSQESIFNLLHPQPHLA